MKTTMKCNKCGYKWWVESIGDVPPNPNCPICFPNTNTKTSFTSTVEWEKQKNMTEAEIRVDKHQKLLSKVEGLRKPKKAHVLDCDDIPTCYACDYNQAIEDVLAELRAKLAEMREGK